MEYSYEWILRRMKAAVGGRHEISMADLLVALGIGEEDERPTSTARRIGMIMSQAGWTREKRGTDQQSWYLRPTTGPAVVQRRKTRRTKVKSHLKARIRARALSRAE